MPRATRSYVSITRATGVGKKCLTSMRADCTACDSNSMNARSERGRNGSVAVLGSALAAGSRRAASTAAAAASRAASPPARNASMSFVSASRSASPVGR